MQIKVSCSQGVGSMSMQKVLWSRGTVLLCERTLLFKYWLYDQENQNIWQKQYWDDNIIF